MKVLTSLPLLLIACADVPQPFELDHERVMAVRIDPPALAPGERAKIEVLVTDADAGPHVADPDAVTVTGPDGADLRREPDGWYATAPSSEVLAGIRGALGLSASADVIVPLALQIAGATTMPAQKTVALGTHADNPAAAEILHDGEAGAIAAAAGADVVLTVTAPADGLSYRWFSSVGDLTGYTRAEAELEPLAGSTGAIAVVVRDQAGGTAWTLLAAQIAP